LTQVSERGQRHGNPFVEVLSRPGALRMSAAGLIGRMPMSMFGLGTLLLIASFTGRYGLAGLVAAAGSVGYAVCAPQAARLADRFGQARVLRPQALFFAATTIALILCAHWRAPTWALLLSGGLAGASMPTLGSMVRARWSTLLGDSPLLHSAFSLESVADELIFVIGPALVTVLATEVYPASGVAVAMTACVIGTLLFAAQRATEPPPGRAPRPRPGQATEPLPGHPAVPPLGQANEPLLGHPAEPPRGRFAEPPLGRSPEPSPGGATEPPLGRFAQPSPSRATTPPSRAARIGRIRLPAPGLATLAPVYFFLGAMFATIDLSTVDFAQKHGHKPLAGFILGCYAAGSAVGGVWYGSRTWRSPVHRRFAITLSLVVAGTATFWAMPGLAVLAVVIFFCGFAISPTLIAGFSLIDGQAAAGRRTEGLTWLTSAISVGVAGGSAVAGHLVDVGGARWGYWFAASCGVAAVVTCLLGLGKLRVQPAAKPAEWADAGY
jgi:MFS family permease